MRQGIGTLSEKTVHAVMKNYYAADTDMHVIFIDNFLYQAVSLGWSAIVLTVCVIMDITIITLLSRKRLRSAVRRRLHF